MASRSRPSRTTARLGSRLRSTARPDIRVKRVYEPADPSDGLRVLVDRIWPRGMSRDAVGADVWLKELAPSTVLRRWFGHDPANWTEFKRRYFAELDAHPERLAPLVHAARAQRVTLLFSAADVAHNHAVALREYLLARLGRAGRRTRARQR